MFARVTPFFQIRNFHLKNNSELVSDVRQHYVEERELLEHKEVEDTETSQQERQERTLTQEFALLNLSGDTVVSAELAELHRMTMSSKDSSKTLYHYQTWSSASSGCSDRSRSTVHGDNESGVAFIDDIQSEKQGAQDFTNVLPMELTQEIMSFLSPADLVACMAVNSRWNAILSSDHVWRELFERNAWSHRPSCQQSRTPIDWKRLFETRYLLEQRWLKGNVKAKVLAGHQDSVYCVFLHESYIVTGSRDRTLKVWDSLSGALLHTLSSETARISHEGSILCIAIAADIDDGINGSTGQYMVTGSSDTSCIIWSLPKFKPLRRVFRHTAQVLAISVNKDYIVSSSRDSTISIWGWDSNYTLKHRFVAHAGPVNAIQINNNRLFSAGGDALVKMWDLETGTCMKTFHGHSRGLACLQVTPCSRYIVSGGNDQTIRIWEIGSSKCVGILEGHKCLVRSLYTIGSKIISGSYDRTINIWDLKTKNLQSSLVGWHGSWIFSAKADVFKIVSTSFGKKPVILDFSHGLDPQMLSLIKG